MANRRRVNAYLTRMHLICALLALMLTIMNYFSIHLPWLKDEDVLVKATWCKKHFRSFFGIHDDKHFIEDNFLLIDISNDIAPYADSGKAARIGLLTDTGSIRYAPCAAGTDLKKLTALFKWLSSNTDAYNMVVCDIILHQLDSTAATTELLHYMVSLAQQPGKIVFSAIYDPGIQDFKTSSFSKEIPKERMGAVNGELVSDMFFRYQLSYRHGEIKTLPLMLYEQLNHAKITPHFNTYSYKTTRANGLAENIFIPEIIFQCADIDSLKQPGSTDGVPIDTNICKMELWQTVLRFDSTDSYYLQKSLPRNVPKKKNIFIGSFNHAHQDMHTTIYENMDGAIILLNLYYNLVHEENKITFIYFLFTFVFFYLIAWVLMHHANKNFTAWWHFMDVFLDRHWDNMQYYLFFIMTVLSSLVFDKATNAIALLVLVIAVDWGIRIFK